MARVDVVQPEGMKPAPGDAQQLLDALHREDLRHEVRQHRGLVAGARPDLEHLPEVAAIEQRLGHAGDDPRLRYGLPAADGQGRILVGSARQRLVDELVAGHLQHGLEHPLVADAVRPQAVHQPVARTLGGHADTPGVLVNAAAMYHASDPPGGASASMAANQPETWSRAW